MGKPSRDKGKRAERAAARLLLDKGWTGARRGQQKAGGVDSPDVMTPDDDRYHWEVKWDERLSLYPAMDQAISDCGGRLPVLLHKRNRKPWLVIGLAEDLLPILRRNQDG